ncbi:MAG: acyl-CoA dehydrogenase family protein [Gammaproteobacteria bacterium]
MEDFLLLDQELLDEEKLVRDNVMRFVEEEVIPHMEQAFEKAEFPRSLMQRMAELGLFGMTLPEQYGGSGASYVSYGLVCQALEYGDSGLRSAVSVQSSLCMYPIYRYGSEEQKQRFLPAMARGEIIGCFGLTEPDSGSDPGSMRTFAKKVDGGWLLNGSKMWITNAPIADIAIVWANTEQGIRGFIVEKDFAGFSASTIKHKMSLRASITGGLAFDNCFIPDENFLPQSDKGLAAPLGCLTQARYGIAWGAIGAAMACYDITVNYAKDRSAFTKPIGSFQLIQKDLVDMFNEIVKAQCMNLRLGRLRDQQQDSYVMVSLAKMNACREALKIARMARNILGGNGISLEYHVIRHMLNLESVFTYEGTDNVHHLIVGRHITGLNAFAN